MSAQPIGEAIPPASPAGGNEGDGVAGDGG